MPVGVFVIFHLFTNFQMVFGTFQHEVNWIHSLPALIVLEVFGLWLPIGFHAALGLVYTFTGRNNVRAYGYEGNWRYALQRTTGILALLFIFYHIATLRWGWDFLGPTFVVTGLQGEELAHASTALAMQWGPLDGWLVTLAYIVGVYSVIYHWSNGLWTAAISWGITITKGSQKRWGYVCAAMGVALSIFAAGAIVSARTYEVTPEQKAAIEAYLAANGKAHASTAPPAH